LEEWLSRYVTHNANSGVADVAKSVLDAIREGDWFFEPAPVEPSCFPATAAIPGTEEKLAVLAARVRAGLPLWHDNDRADYEEPESTP
jgi:hypothetical protein